MLCGDRIAPTLSHPGDLAVLLHTQVYLGGFDTEHQAALVCIPRRVASLMPEPRAATLRTLEASALPLLQMVHTLPGLRCVRAGV